MRFNINKIPCVGTLFDADLETAEFSDEVVLHGEACKKFGKWNV